VQYASLAEAAPAALTSRCVPGRRAATSARTGKRNTTMAWTTPTLVEICIGLEINGYLPAEI
jgi:coenzyme PQQ precursor peptide PqqA